MPDQETDQTFCAVRLRATTERAPAAIGQASVVTSSKYDMELVDVVVGLLPDPSVFGLDNYTFILIDPGTGVIFIRQAMVTVPSGEGAWGGTFTHDLGSGAVPLGLVLVFASDVAGLLGPQVAGGTLADCACPLMDEV